MVDLRTVFRGLSVAVLQVARAGMPDAGGSLHDVEFLPSF